MPGSPWLHPETTTSILKSRSEIDGLRCEVQEVIARSHDSVFRSLRLIEEIEQLLAAR
jgi:hypothetical protein